MDRSSYEFDIASLFQHTAVDYDVINSVLYRSSEPLPGPCKTDIPESYLTGFSSTSRDNVKDYPEQSKPVSSGRSVTVNGADVGDFPAEYHVKGLRYDELPVIGSYIHPNVVPGFKYRVRQLGNDRSLFTGGPLRLLSVGRGYAKRISFEGESLNCNNNYFYSDTHDDGYGFSISAIKSGDMFLVQDPQGLAVGQGVVLETMLQKETLSSIKADGTLVKLVFVRFTCDVSYGPEKHGLMPLFSEGKLDVCGTAVMMKGRRSPAAVTSSVQQVELPNYGQCVFSFSK